MKRYILSDIHGNQRRFHSILEQIDLQPEDALYILGDVIDCHPDGIKLLREIMAMPKARMLLGNHEYMMMRALGEPYDGDSKTTKNVQGCMALWYRNEGHCTHQSWKHTRKTLRKEILSYLKALPLNIDIEVNDQRYKLVHAAPVEAQVLFGKPKETQTHFAVWNRKAVCYRSDTDYITIFGHTPTSCFQSGDLLKILKTPAVIGIDCGSGFPEWSGIKPDEYHGRLACLRLEDMQEFYSEG